MSESLSIPSGSLNSEEQLALVSLYSTLVDEEKFNLENDIITPDDDFLKEVEEKIVAKGDNSLDLVRFQELKNKILEKVKIKKVNRKLSKQRRGSTSSINTVGTSGLKRHSSLNAGGATSRSRLDSTPPTSNHLQLSS